MRLIVFNSRLQFTFLVNATITFLSILFNFILSNKLLTCNFISYVISLRRLYMLTCSHIHAFIHHLFTWIIFFVHMFMYITCITYVLTCHFVYAFHMSVLRLIVHVYISYNGQQNCQMLFFSHFVSF